MKMVLEYVVITIVLDIALWKKIKHRVLNLRLEQYNETIANIWNVYL